MEQSIVTPRGEVVLRPPTEADAVAYRALRLEALQLHPEAFGSDYVRSAAEPLSYWQEQMRRGARGEDGVLYLAEAAGALIGMTGLDRESRTKRRHSGTIVSVYTAAAWRGAGVADALLAACLGHGRALGLRIVRLAVVAMNAPAIRLYLRHGFTVYGVEHEALAVDGRLYDELLMAVTLASAEIPSAGSRQV